MLQVEKKVLNNLWDHPLREILFLLNSVRESKTEIILILIIIIMALLVSYCLGLQWALVSLLHSFYPLVLVHHSSKVSEDSCEIMS